MTMSSVQRILKGDIIIERTGGKDRMIPVRKVEYNACSSKGVHINTSMCFDSTAVVRLVDGDGTLSDLRDEVEIGKDAPELHDFPTNEDLAQAGVDMIEAWADRIVRV